MMHGDERVSDVVEKRPVARHVGARHALAGGVLREAVVRRYAPRELQPPHQRLEVVGLFGYRHTTATAKPCLSGIGNGLTLRRAG